MILLLMCTMDDMRLSAILLPVWICLWHLKRCVGNKAFTSSTNHVRSHPFDESGFFNYCLNAPARERYIIAGWRLMKSQTKLFDNRKYVIEYISLNAFIFQPHHGVSKRVDLER